MTEGWEVHVRRPGQAGGVVVVVSEAATPLEAVRQAVRDMAGASVADVGPQMPVERVKALVRLLCPEDMTPVAARQILAACEEAGP